MTGPRRDVAAEAFWLYGGAVIGAGTLVTLVAGGIGALVGLLVAAILVIVVHRES